MIEVLKDIFVSYDIAVQLKEIGFDEPCMAFFEKDIEFKIHTTVTERLSTVYLKEIKSIDYNAEKNVLSLPTWEQVFKWFREKNYLSSVVSNFGSFYGYIEHTREAEAFAIDGDYSSYEEAREQLILKLIEVYKNDKK